MAFPIVGFTWFSLLDQVDWDSALQNPAGHVNALGLYDLDRKIRPVGQAYKELIALWNPVLKRRELRPAFFRTKKEVKTMAITMKNLWRERRYSNPSFYPSQYRRQ